MFPKLVRLKDGSVAAGCGLTMKATAFIAWLDAGKKGKRPPLDDDTAVIHMQRDGLVLEYSEFGSVAVCGEFEAWGSGLEPALGALWAGCSAEEAAHIATKVDKSSGEPVFTMRVEKPSPAPKKRKKPGAPR